MQPAITYHPSIRQIPYGLRTFLYFMAIVAIMSPVFLYLFNNFAAAGFLSDETGVRDAYILRSEETMKRLQSTGGNSDGYEQSLKTVNSIMSDAGYRCKIISESELSNLDAHDTLFVMDALSLSDETLNHIREFVSGGGSLVFNFYSAFNDSHGAWRGDAFVKSITSLSVDPTNPSIKKQEGIFLTPKLLSPLSGYLENGPAVSMVLYDDLPLFKTPDKMMPDAFMTNWSQFATPTVADTPLAKEYAGAVWHGTYGKGNWIYFNFPSYVLQASNTDAPYYAALFKGFADYAIKGVVVRKHPYLTDIQPIFISEDTEFHFENAQGFSQLVEKYKVPVTAFCVAMLAEQNRDVTIALSKNPYVEVASHSYTHGEILGVDDSVITHEITDSKQVLEAITHTKVEGFRPPREEINDAVAVKLVSSGFTYTMEKNHSQLYPKTVRDTLIVIPRIGTDDYGYLTQYSFDEAVILNQMKREQQLLHAMDGVYTLSVHTHLFSDPKNLHLIESFLNDTQHETDATFVQGRDLSQRVREVNKIDVSISLSSQNYLISVRNNNTATIAKATIRVYWPKWGEITTISSDTLGVTFEAKHNQNERYSDITFTNLKPSKQFTLIAKHNAIS